jgi:outer membrane receptor protein involved in Fe transport
VAPQAPTAPSTAAGGGVAPTANPLGAVGSGSATTVSATQQANASQVSASVVSGAQAPALNSTDAGDLLRKSPSALGVDAQRRSPIANETRIRGYRLGQIVTEADRQFWFPAREDLDTFLSKIDSGIIRDVVIVKGPYSAGYGPGLAFLDIETAGTPRYQHGFEWHGATTANYNFNGQQLYGRQQFLGGDQDWGFNISYGQRTAGDYRDGSGFRIPSRYDSRDIDANIGANLTENSSLEFSYLRLDQTELLFPGQIFDTDFLVTNSYRATYTVVNQPVFDMFTATGYYNRTSLHGDAQRESKRDYIPQLNVLNFIGFTDIDQSSTGYRLATTWGKAMSEQLTVGTDFRWTSGSLNEHDSLFSLPCLATLNFPIPPNHQLDIGWFAMHVMPYDDWLTIKTGVRADYWNSNIDKLAPMTTCDQTVNVLGSNDFDRSEGLFLGYATAEYKPVKEWTFSAGMGTAQRPPTQTELYAEGPFLAILQNGFTTVFGNPNLAPERSYQLDGGIKATYENVRLGLNGFFSFVNDYVTYESLPVLQQGIVKIPANFQSTTGRTIRFVNTDLATLDGFEAYADVDLTAWLTPFATMTFVEGNDQTVGSHFTAGVPAPVSHEPLPGIPPLDTRVGLRFHEERLVPTWGVEVYARMVAAQDRVALSLGELPSAGFTIWDTRAYWQIRKGCQLTGGIENIFDRFYREHLDLRTGRGVYQPGISPYMGLELNY